MKHILSLAALSASMLLLSGCPNSQPPTPGPKAPEPKAALAQPIFAHQGLQPNHHQFEITGKKTS